MKRIFALASAILITVGLKAQNANAQKETVKPSANAGSPVTTNKAAVLEKNVIIKKADQKDVSIKKTETKANEFKNAEIKNAAIKNAEIKNAAIKKAAVKQ